MSDITSDSAAWADAALESLTVRYGMLDVEFQRRLASASPDDDGPVWMVNLMRYRERADYGDGSSSELTGQQSDDQYAPLDSLAESWKDEVQHR